MMPTPSETRTSIIIPALLRMGLYSWNAERLLMGTAAIESQFTALRQIPRGPAVGLFQMEPPTFAWLINDFLKLTRYRKLRPIIVSMTNSSTPVVNEMIFNNLFAAAMARVRYLAVTEPMPCNLEAQAQYWWIHYNGRSPHGLKPADYIARWNQYCEPIYAHLPSNGPVEVSTRR